MSWVAVYFICSSVMTLWCDEHNSDSHFVSRHAYSTQEECWGDSDRIFNSLPYVAPGKRVTLSCRQAGE
jgi:hypothetical protein